MAKILHLLLSLLPPQEESKCWPGAEFASVQSQTAWFCFVLFLEVGQFSLEKKKKAVAFL